MADELVNPTRHPFGESMGLDDEKRRLSFAQYLLNDTEALEGEKLFRQPSDVIGDDKFRSQIIVVDGRLTARKRGRPQSSNGR